MDGWMEKWIKGWIKRLIDELMDGWINKWMDGWMKKERVLGNSGQHERLGRRRRSFLSQLLQPTCDTRVTNSRNTPTLAYMSYFKSLLISNENSSIPTTFKPFQLPPPPSNIFQSPPPFPITSHPFFHPPIEIRSVFEVVQFVNVLHKLQLS